MTAIPRLALVTGGGRGIGAACARALARRGMKVVVTGRTEEAIAAVADDIGGIAIRCDLLDRADTDALIAKVSEIDRVSVLVNNAGIAESAPLAKVADETWDRLLELNTTAPFRLIRALAPEMVDAGWGRIVNIASNAGVSGYKYSAAYCASKHALVGLTRALAIDLAPTGVTINAICPGWVATNMVEEATARIAGKTGMSADDALAALAKMSPQKRVFEPQEIAYVAAMLCDDDARGIHGQTIVIDGGAVLK